MPATKSITLLVFFALFTFALANPHALAVPDPDQPEECTETKAKACIASIAAAVGGAITIVTCFAAAAGTAGIAAPVAAVCVAGLTPTITAAIGAAGATCKGCKAVDECKDDNKDAWDRACGKGDKFQRLGPNACVQLSTSVPNPSKTDKSVDGGFTYHCANKPTMSGNGGDLCWTRCSKCPDCAGVPTEEKRDVPWLG